MLAFPPQDNPSSADLEMIEALLQQMQGGAAGIYDLHHEDDDDEDYDDEDDEEDDEDYYGDEAHMYQGGGGYGDAGHMAGGDQANVNQLMQHIMAMNGLGGDALQGLAPGMMPGMEGGHEGGFDMGSMMPGMAAGMAGAFGAAAAGIMEGMAGPGGMSGHGGAVITDYDEEDDEEDEEEDEDEVSECTDSEEEEDCEDEEGRFTDMDPRMMGGMAAAAMMGGAMGAAGQQMFAGMMSPQQQHQMMQQQHQQMMPPHPMMQQQQQMPTGMSPSSQVGFMMPQHPGMYPGPHGAPHMSPQAVPMGMSQPPMAGGPSSSSGSSMMQGFVAAAGATAVAAGVAAAAAAATSSTASPAPQPVQAEPSSIPPTPKPSAVTPAPAPPSPAPSKSSSTKQIAPTISLSNAMGGGTVSRVDPLSGLAGGKVISNTLSNKTSGGTALVKSDHLSASTPAKKPHNKSVDELDKLSESMAKAKIAPTNSMPPPNNAAMQQYTQQMMMQQQYMMHVRPPMTQLTPKHLSCDGDKKSLDRESVRSSEVSGGGKSDTESTTKKTPSPINGRASPDSSSEASSSGSSRGHAKNSTSYASLSDLQSGTESLRDSDTDHHFEQIQRVQRRLGEIENDPSLRNHLMTQTPLLIQTPTYGWSALVGHENAKEALKNLFLGKKFPEVFDQQGSCRGVLLFGPSGAGKTSLARTLGFEVGGAKLIANTPNFGLQPNLPPQNAAMVIRQMFDHARVHKPCVMLLDEIDMLALKDLNEAGRWAKAELLAQVRGQTTLSPAYPPSAGINDQIMLVATTCSPWVLPEDLRTLFAYNIHIKLPNEKHREELFRMFLNNYPNNITGDQYSTLISKSEG